MGDKKKITPIVIPLDDMEGESGFWNAAKTAGVEEAIFVPVLYFAADAIISAMELPPWDSLERSALMKFVGGEIGGGGTKNGLEGERWERKR